MEKLYDRIDFHNDTTPALNETNLNAMSKGIDDIDDRLINVANMIGSGGGGSAVEWNQIQTSGTKIAEITIDGATQDVFAPNGGGGTTTEYGTSAEFEAEKDSFPVGTEYLITDDYDEYNAGIYSDNEILIGKFLDKNLYRKVFRTTENVTNSNKEYNQTDASAIKDIVNIHFVVEHTSHSWCISAQGTVQNNHIYAKGESNDTPTSGMYTNIVVEYTKVGE